MDSIFWLTYYYELFSTYISYYWLYFIQLFADYPFVVQVSAFFTTAMFMAIFVVSMALLLKAHFRKKKEQIWHHLNERFAEGISYCLSAESSPKMTRQEVIKKLGIEEDLAQHKVLLKSTKEKRLFAKLLRDLRFTYTNVKGRHENLAHILEIFSIPSFLENEVSTAGMHYKVHAMNAIRVFKLPISLWVINKLINSKWITVRRLAMYSSVSNSSDSDMDYFESDFFDKTCCVYDEIELAYALQRRRSRGLRLPNLARWAYMQKNPATQCVFVRLMRRFNQDENCDQLRNLFQESKHKKLIEEISRTWGYLHYVDGEQLLVDTFLMQPDDTKVAILHAVTRMATGKQLDLMSDSFHNTVNPHVRFEALRCMYNYGEEGRALFHKTEAEATESEKKYFAFFHNPITLEKIRLDKEQAYHPSIETVYNLSY